LTDAEEAEIQAGIAADPDNPELTDEELASLRPFSEAFPELAASIARARGIPTVIIGPDDAVAFGLSPEEIALYEKSCGKDWRARVTIPDEAKRLRGRPKIANPKQAVTLRLSPKTIARYKAIGGADWRARMIETLERAASG
jgi:uncharacterized protein (DUF4415 family)